MNIDLRQGEAIEQMKLIPNKSIDAIITDIPYGTTSCKWDNVIPFDQMWEQLNRIIKQNGAIVLFGSEPFSSALRMSNIKNYKYDWYYKKRIASNFASAKYQPMKHIENIMVFSKDGKKVNYYPIKQQRAESGKNRIKAGYKYNSKKGDSSKIGYFGSGNKFALAYLLRNNFKVKIYGGEKEIEIGTVPKKLKDKTYDVITINKKETSITTEFGAKWELWQALRELYSNAKDEGGEGLELVNDINPKKGCTHIYIKVKPEITEWLSKFDDYFAENKEVLFENEYGRILKKHDNHTHLYRKGISVYHSDKNSLYDYDFNYINITEDRVVKYSWEIPRKIWNLIYSCTDEEIIKNIITNSNNNVFEGELGDFSDISPNKVSDEFKKVLKEGKYVARTMTGWMSEDDRLNTTILPTKLFNSIKHLLEDKNIIDRMKIGRDNVLYREIKITTLQKATLNKVFDFLSESKYDGIFDYDIVIAKFDNKNIMGTINTNEDKIILSEVCIEKGANYTLETLIEEYVHLKYGVYDETREMQDALIQEIVTIMKNKNAFVL